MNVLIDFVVDNFWICLGAGVILVIIGDEILGVSRNLLADETDNLKFEPRNREKEPVPEDPLDEDPPDDETPIEDFLPRG